ncbi:MAG: hypothetical protein Kow00124_01420 [Anaerolineae bacterium]
MAKKTRRSKSQVVVRKSTLQYVLIGVGALMLLAAGLVLLAPGALGGGTAASEVQLLAPDRYRAEFEGRDDVILLDVRTPEEFASGYIPGAINIPLDSLEERLSEIPTDKTVVVYCRSGNRSQPASRLLADAGYEVYNMGGIIDWDALGYPIETP